MNEIEIKIKLPELWGSHLFSKNEWGSINLLVGANGTGKSLFAEKLKTQINQRGFSVRMLNVGVGSGQA